MNMSRRRSRQRNLAHTVRSASPLMESLEPRQLLTGVSIERVSVTSAGVPADASSGTSSMSSDGNLVVFTSVAALVPGITENGQDLVYLRNRSLGTTTLISLGYNGDQPDAKCAEPVISSDGNFIAYSSPATNLVPGDTNGQQDIFLYDVAHATTTLISTGAGSTQTDSTSSSPSISADGRYVAFLSNATNLVANDNNNASDIFVYDRQSSTITRVSVTAAGVEALGASYSPALSADGNYVAFVSDAANLIPSDTNNVSDVFLKDLTTGNPTSGSVTRVSVSSAGVQANGQSGRIAINSTGQFVVFESSANTLVANDTNNNDPANNPAATDIFLYNRSTATTTRISVSASGAQANGISTKPAISANGRYITYTSDATNLITANNPAATDVFLYDQTNGAVRRISSGPNDSLGNDASDDSSISGDGNYIAFRSNATNFVPNDTNGVGDIFVKNRLAVPTASIGGSPDGTNPQPITSGSTSTDSAHGTDFGIVDISDPAVTHTFTITNTGSDPLILSGPVTVSGTNAAEFVIISQPDTSTPIQPGDSVTFDVRFDPTAPGIRTATLTVPSNDPAAVNYTFAVSGAAIDQTNTFRLLITQDTTTVPTGPGANFSFGNVALNATPKDITFTITNVSSQNLSLDQISLANATGFQIVNNISVASLAPGQTTVFTLRLQSAIAGASSAIVNLSNTGSDTVASSFTVAGNVITSTATLLLNGQTLTKGQTVDFGSVVSGATAVSKTFTIRNDGLAPLTIGTVTLPAGFALASTVPATIQPGDTATLVIQLDSSTGVGIKLGLVSIVTNDPNSPTYTLTLSGTVTAPALSVSLDGSALASGAAVTFPDSSVGSTGPTKTFTITNTGTATLTLSSPSTPSGYILDTVPAASLAPGASTTFTIRVNTTSAATLSGTVNITSNASTSTFSLTLNATVQSLAATVTLLDNGAAVTGTAITFGTLLQSATPVTKTLTLSNTGNINLTVTSVTLPAGFTLKSSPASTLAPGASSDFVISFIPIVAGSQGGVLSIVSNDSSHPTFTAGLTATVTTASKTSLGVDSVKLGKIPSTVIGGSKTAKGTASVTLNNYSSATLSGTYKITVYASPGLAAVPGTDKILGTLSIHLNLKSKAKSSYTVKLAFPTPPSDGPYNIVAVVSGPKVDPVYNTNRAPFTIRVEKAQAKIDAGKPASPALKLSAGSKVTQSLSITNSGNTAIKGSATADLYLSTDGTLTNATKITTLKGLAIKLNPKATQKLSLKFTLPKSTVASTTAYTLLVKITKITSSTAYTLLSDSLSAGKITVK